MQEKQLVEPDQSTAHESPCSLSNRVLRWLREFCWAVFCRWTPKPVNPWRIFWLRIFGAKIDGKPFVHQCARIVIPWHLTLHDRAVLGDRANAYTLGEIEIGPRENRPRSCYNSSFASCSRSFLPSPMR